MHKLTIRIAVACLTLLIGLIAGQGLRLFRCQPQAHQSPPCATPIPTPEPQTEVSEDFHDDEYPETSGLKPWEISSFIDSYPQAKLKRLWERLGTKPNSDSVSDFSECGNCKAQITDYNLDNEPGDESLLKISDGVSESYRYLIFKQVNQKDEWKLVGHIDAWGKYRDSQAIVLASGGYNWLVIQGQSASGSGVSLYNTRIYEVTPKQMKLVAFYQSEGYQSSFEAWPTKQFTSRIISCEKDRGQRIVTVEFKVDYSVWSEKNNENLLFSKYQTAVFEKTANNEPVLETKRSSLTKRELEHIYNIDSMTDVDFLQYNYGELAEVARRGTKTQRAWLRSYLGENVTNSEQQRKLAARVK